MRRDWAQSLKTGVHIACLRPEANVDVSAPRGCALEYWKYNVFSLCRRVVHGGITLAQMLSGFVHSESYVSGCEHAGM